MFCIDADIMDGVFWSRAIARKTLCIVHYCHALDVSACAWRLVFWNVHLSCMIQERLEDLLFANDIMVEQYPSRVSDDRPCAMNNYTLQLTGHSSDGYYKWSRWTGVAATGVHVSSSLHSDPQISPAETVAWCSSLPLFNGNPASSAL